MSADHQINSFVATANMLQATVYVFTICLELLSASIYRSCETLTTSRSFMSKYDTLHNCKVILGHTSFFLAVEFMFFFPRRACLDVLIQ